VLEASRSTSHFLLFGLFRTLYCCGWSATQPRSAKAALQIPAVMAF